MPANSTSIDVQEPIFKVLEETSPTKSEAAECLCPIGKFWHWRLKSCIAQGPWGYECGFFPEEHHHRVCQDGLKCQKLAGAEDNYHSHGIHKGRAGTFPASCVPCKEGECKTGEERHKEECLKRYEITGDACSTVQVSMPVTEFEVSATESYTASATEAREATA